MNKIKRVKFFLVAAALIVSGSLANAEEAFDWGSDPNGGIGAPGTSVVDNALEPVPVDCHDCGIAARASGPRGSLFGPRGIVSGNEGSSEDVSQ